MIGELSEAIVSVDAFADIPVLMAKALAGGISLEGAGEALSIGAAGLFLRSLGGNPMDVHLQPASIWDPQAFIARLAEIVCHDNFTEMHAFKHHQSIVEEYHATHEPWRWMHLVCGAQAAAISFGKSMTVYEEYLELLHAA